MTFIIGGGCRGQSMTFVPASGHGGQSSMTFVPASGHGRLSSMTFVPASGHGWPSSRTFVLASGRGGWSTIFVLGSGHGGCALRHSSRPRGHGGWTTTFVPTPWSQRSKCESGTNKWMKFESREQGAGVEHLIISYNNCFQHQQKHTSNPNFTFPLLSTML